MLLALDIGNTNIKIGVFDDADSNGYSPAATWRISSDRKRMADEYAATLLGLLALGGYSASDVSAAAICSGVPPLTPEIVSLCRTYLDVEPVVVGAGVRTGVKVLYDPPRDVGADRIANAVGALKLYGGPAIVVDFGTGTVFDALSADAEYLGGAIAPGIIVAADALFHSASQLRRVELRRPGKAIGRNTVHALQSGLVLGYTDMVKGMVARFDEELGGGARVIGTGGLSDLIAGEAGVFDAVNQDLTLSGLSIVHELNR